MTKYVVSNIELIKKDYLVDAYTKEAAQEKAHLQPPRTRVSLGEITHSVTPINEYEYNREWKPLDPDIGPDQLKDQQKDWVFESDGRAKQKKDHEGYEYEIELGIYRDD